MLRHTRPFVLLITAALIAGCGGDSPSASPTQKSRIKPNAAAPSGSGELRVGTTAGGIGDAATGNVGGIKILPSTKVPGQSNTQQGVGAGASCENADITPEGENLTVVVVATLCLLNGERADAGLGPLKQNAKLASAAVQHSQEMVAQQYFDHTGKDGTDPVDRIRNAGYIPSVGTWTVGENLAWGTGALATPKEIVAAWMKSQGHRENILRPAFKEIGFGVVTGNPRSDSGSGATYTTTFGGVSKVATAAAPKHKSKKAKRRARRARARIAKGKPRSSRHRRR
jgi:uncharacterized protein YkwD